MSISKNTLLSTLTKMRKRQDINYAVAVEKLVTANDGFASSYVLKQNGVQLESWQTVSESKQEAHAEDYQGSSKNPYRESENDHKEQDSDGESFAEIIASM